jgi:hypothetical protein
VFVKTKKNEKAREEKLIDNSKDLLSLYERLRDTAIKSSGCAGVSGSYGMSVLLTKGMLFWLKLLSDMEATNTKTPVLKSEIFLSSKKYSSSLSDKLKDALVEMVLKKIKKEYGLCHMIPT